MTPTALKRSVKQLLCRTVWKFSAAELTAHLRKQGISSGDSVIVHASWHTDCGFYGSPAEMIGAIKQAIGPQGLLVMTSMPYQNQSSKDFLENDGKVNVRRSPSKMGLLTEVFRRNKETRRSLSPTHPLLAWGPDAESFLANHEKALSPFGSDSPFQKLLERDAKILTIDAPFATVTFTHFVEDKIAHHLPYSLYEQQIYNGTVIDTDGNSHTVPVQVLSAQANALRREHRYVSELENNRVIHHSRLGNSRLQVIGCREMLECAENMYEKGQSFFDMPE